MSNPTCFSKTMHICPTTLQPVQLATAAIQPQQKAQCWTLLLSVPALCALGHQEEERGGWIVHFPRSLSQALMHRCPCHRAYCALSIVTSCHLHCAAGHRVPCGAAQGQASQAAYNPAGTCQGDTGPLAMQLRLCPLAAPTCPIDRSNPGPSQQ